MDLFPTIICCINLTENSEDIVRYTKDIAQAHGSRILVTHNVPSMSHLANYVESQVVANVVATSKERARNYLEKFVADHFQGMNAEGVLTEGDPARSLLDLVDRQCADLVVMGSMSTKGPLSFLLSRPSDTVVGKTRVPVMVIPNDLSLDCVPPENF